MPNYVIATLGVPVERMNVRTASDSRVDHSTLVHRVFGDAGRFGSGRSSDLLDPNEAMMNWCCDDRALETIEEAIS